MLTFHVVFNIKRGCWAIARQETPNDHLKKFSEHKYSFVMFDSEDEC